MWRKIRKSFKSIAIVCFSLIFLLGGFPSALLLEYVSKQAVENNIIDSLYWSMKNPNVIDQGLKEVLKPRVEEAKAATFSIQTGYYIGNATDNRAITGLGFSPDLVLLKDNTTAGADGILWKTTSMAGDSAALLGEAEANIANNIQSLDADGFTIGSDTDVNSSNVLHYWVAFDGSDCTASGTFCVGSYSGNGTSQSLNIGFQPDMVIVKRSGASLGVWKSSAMTGTNTNYFSATTQDTGGQMIQSLDATGFTVGNNATVNTSSNTYWYVAFKQVSNFMDVGTYTGNGTDNRNITSTDDAGLTFQPDFVFVKSTHVTTPTTAVFNNTESYGDRSFLSTDAASAANHIQDLRAAGGFEVGSSTSVNGSGNTLYYAAFAGADLKPPGTGTFDMINGSYSGTGTGFSVTGLGFAPDLVIIKHHDQTTDQYAVWRSRVMVGDITHYFGNAVSTFAGGITALGADGFTIGTNATVNTAGDTYYWTAFGNAMEPDISGGSSDFLIGAYIGDGQDNTDVRHLPIQPDFVAVKRVSTTAGSWRTSDQSGDLSLHFAATAQGANIIQNFSSEGFQKGTAANTNTAGSTYHYFIFKDGVRFLTNTYTGNGSTQNIISAGFQPDHVWIKKTTGGTARAAVLRTSAQSGNAAQPFLNVATLTSVITNLIAGGFSLGNGVESNENTAVYQYAAWDSKKYTQQSYRLFANNDSTDVGAALAEQSTPVTLSAPEFRLRMLMRVDNGNLFSSGQDFKLQYVDKGTGSCANPLGGTPAVYTDVTGATLISYNDNATPADGAAITPNANDPTDGVRTIVNQTYEEANNLTNSQGAVNNLQDAKFDFSLTDNGSTTGTTFCFRLVKSNGTVLDTYTAYPEVTTSSSVLTMTMALSDNSLGFGTCSSVVARYATGDSLGSGSETVAHTIDVATSGTYGYALSVQGGTLTRTSGGQTITAIGGSPAASNPGTEQFGIRATVSGGTATVASPYNHASNYGYSATASTQSTIGSASAASTDTFSLRYLCNIGATTEAGVYTTTLTYTAVGSF